VPAFHFEKQTAAMTRRVNRGVMASARFASDEAVHEGKPIMVFLNCKDLNIPSSQGFYILHYSFNMKIAFWTSLADATEAAVSG